MNRCAQKKRLFLRNQPDLVFELCLHFWKFLDVQRARRLDVCYDFCFDSAKINPEWHQSFVIYDPWRTTRKVRMSPTRLPLWYKPFNFSSLLDKEQKKSYFFKPRKLINGCTRKSKKNPQRWASGRYATLHLLFITSEAADRKCESFTSRATDCKV